MNSFSAQSRANIEFVADLIRNSKHTVVLTGAGISTPSGIPDFRSTGTGLWSRDEPLEVASLSTFRTKPGQFFEWFRPLARQMFEAKPNAAHAALAEMETRGFIKAVITQNIDALHQKSGSQIVIETHGTMRTLTCTQCYHQAQAGAHIERFVETGELPRCPAGSSLEVLPVAGLPMQALDRGAHLVVVNNTPTYINVRADAAILEDVAAVLPAIAERVLNG